MRGDLQFFAYVSVNKYLSVNTVNSLLFNYFRLYVQFLLTYLEYNKFTSF